MQASEVQPGDGMEGAGKKKQQQEKESAYSSQKSLKRVNNYVLGDVLGEGAYGQVREGLLIKEGPKFGQRVAVKILSRRLLRKVRNGQENLKREVNCVRKLKHKNVIQLIEVIDESGMDKIYLVFELANLVSLQDLCDLNQKLFDKTTKGEGPQSARRGIPEPYARNLFLQLIQGLKACHSKGVVHRDIKPSNLQLTSDGVVKIIDFGVAETLDHFSSLDDTEKFAGTPAYQPPEVAQGQRSFSATKVDIWAAGVTLYVMVTGATPFTGNSIDELYSNISKGEYVLPDDMDGDLRGLLQAIMHPEPDKRLSLDAILQHSWCQQEVAKLETLGELLDTNISKKNPKNSLLSRFMEEYDSEQEEGGGDSDEDKIDEDRLRHAEILSGKRASPMPYSAGFNKNKQSKLLSAVPAAQYKDCCIQ